MENFTAKAGTRLHILRLDPGDDLLDCVNALIKKEGIVNGAVVSGIGTFSSCCLHSVTTTGYPPVERFDRWEDVPMELASVDGIIANGMPHLHAVVSDDKGTYAGHVEPGCVILYLGELLIAEFEIDGLHRRKNEKGINELTVGK